MPRVTEPFPGTGIDIAVQRDGQFVVATVEGSQIRLERSGGVAYSSPAPGGILGREMRIAVADDGRIAVIAHVVTPSQPVVNLDAGNPSSPWKSIPGGLFGERYVAIAFRNGRFVWATVTSTADVLRIEDETGSVEPRPIKATSQGILYWADEPVLADDRRDVTAGPVRLFHGITIGPATIGTLTTPSDRLVLVVGDQVVPIAEGNPSRPRLAVDGTTVYVAYSQAGSKVATLTPPYLPIAVPAPIVAIGRPLWVGWFKFGASAVPPPGNCEIAVTQGAPLFVTANGQRLAAYAAGNPDGDIDALERAIEAAKVYGLPVLAYWPRSLQSGRLPRGASLIGVEAYKLKTETVLDYETRVTAAVRRCAAPWVLANVYTSNALNDPDLTLVPPVIARIAKNNPNVAGILGFSAGEGRRTGWDDHPEVHEAWRQVVAGISSAPALPEGTTVKAPGVDVLDWRPIDLATKSGRLIKFRDRNNPQFGTVDVTLRNGSIHVEIANAADKNTTGVTRKVI